LASRRFTAVVENEGFMYETIQSALIVPAAHRSKAAVFFKKELQYITKKSARIVFPVRKIHALGKSRIR
jgi:hypothetical protein